MSQPFISTLQLTTTTTTNSNDCAYKIFWRGGTLDDGENAVPGTLLAGETAAAQFYKPTTLGGSCTGGQ